MTFHSILYEHPDNVISNEEVNAPVFFVDLNLDQIIDTIIADRTEYNLRPFFQSLLKDFDAINYRHEIMRDIENGQTIAYINTFARKMRTMRENLNRAEKLYYQNEKQRWFLDAVENYCDAASGLAQDLVVADPKSRGLTSFREYLLDYVKSGHFTALQAESKKLKTDLASIRYSLIIKYGSVKVSSHEPESDYSADVLETFRRFKQGEVKDYTFKFSTPHGLNHVEAGIVALIARLYPNTFSSIESFCENYRSFTDEVIARFDREIQFYVAYLEYIAFLKRINLKFCYPRISDKDKSVYDYDGFDLALAFRCIKENATLVCNDFYLKGKERILVVSGPNQGGKTTFARTFGQLHYLARLGCPVPGSKAQLFFFDKLFTHFEKEENIANLRGKLEDDLLRIHEILQQSTSNSIIILNEIFTSTTLIDAVSLSKKIVERIIRLDALCVCVTFIDELASLSEQTVSMVSTVVPENPALRTFKIVQRPADGLAYAISIAEKHRLTYDCLKRRLKP